MAYFIEFRSESPYTPWRWLTRHNTLSDRKQDLKFYVRKGSAIRAAEKLLVNPCNQLIGWEVREGFNT